MSENKLSISEWIEKHGGTPQNVRLADWAWLKSRDKDKRNEFYKKELSKYFDNESLSSLFNDEYDFDSFDNYLKNLFKYVYRNSLIYYYKDKEGSETELEKAYRDYGEYNWPNNDAKYAVFSLNFKETKNEGTIFACFKRKAHHATIFEFECLKSSNEGVKKWREILIDCLIDLTQKKRMKDIYETIKERIKHLDFEDIAFRDHLLEKDDTDRMKRLPKEIRDCFVVCDKSRETQEKLLKELIKLKMVETYRKEGNIFIPYWEFSTEKDKSGTENDRSGTKENPISLLYPIYLIDENAQGALVFNIKKSKNNKGGYCLSEPMTILSLEQAYSNAKTFNPKFKSTWLNVETVKKSIEAGCKSV